MLHNTDAKPPLRENFQTNIQIIWQRSQFFGFRSKKPSILMPGLTALP